MRKTATKTNKINRKPPPAKMPPMIANGSPRYRRDNAMYTRPPAITQSENGFCRIRAHIPPVPATESPAAGPARISGTLRLRSPWSMFRGISHPGTEARSTNRLERDRTRAPPCARFGSSRAVPSRSFSSRTRNRALRTSWCRSSQRGPAGRTSTSSMGSNARNTSPYPQVTKAYNARVFAIEPRVEARKAALDCGADRAVGPDEAGVAFRDFANDAGADVDIDFVGTKGTFDLGRSLLGPGGRFVAVAPGSEAVQVTANDLVDGGKAYLGAYSSTMADFARAISLAEAGRLRPVVTRKAPLADAAEVLNDLRDGKIVGRAVLFPGPMG